MQHWLIKDKRIRNITCNWCYIIWFSPEMVFLPVSAFQRQVGSSRLRVTTFHNGIYGVKTITMHRAVVVASIPMLLGQHVLDNIYFRHHHYYGHLLSIVKIYNPEEGCWYARPASVIINNTGLKCWPYRGTTPSEQFQASYWVHRYYDICLLEYWMSLNWQNLLKNFRHGYYCQSS